MRRMIGQLSMQNVGPRRDVKLYAFYPASVGRYPHTTSHCTQLQHTIIELWLASSARNCRTKKNPPRTTSSRVFQEHAQQAVAK